MEEERAAEDAAVPRVDEERGREDEGAEKRGPGWRERITITRFGSACVRARRARRVLTCEFEEEGVVGGAAVVVPCAARSIVHGDCAGMQGRTHLHHENAEERDLEYRPDHLCMYATEIRA